MPINNGMTSSVNCGFGLLLLQDSTSCKGKPCLYNMQTCIEIPSYEKANMSASWSYELSTCCSALWRCDCSADCCLACEAGLAAYRPSVLSVQILGEIAGAAGIKDFCALFCLGACQLVPGAGAITRGLVRTEVREVKGIKGDGCTDCLTHFFCGSCAIYQEARELNLRRLVTQQPTGA